MAFRDLRSRACACLLVSATHIFPPSSLLGCSHGDTVDNCHVVDIALFWVTLVLHSVVTTRPLEKGYPGAAFSSTSHQQNTFKIAGTYKCAQ